MSLAEKLDALREGAKKRVPEEKRAVMGKATADLRASGILDRVAGVGATLPGFSLTIAHGLMVQSADLLARGAVVLTIFRGSW